MIVFLPAKHNSSRLPFKNMRELVCGYSVFGWSFERAKLWFPEARFIVASNSRVFQNHVQGRAEFIHLSKEQVEDREDGTIPWMFELISRLPKPVLYLDVSKPITFLSDIKRAMADPRETISTQHTEQLMRPGESNHSWKYPPATKLVGNFILFKGQVSPWEDWAKENIEVSWAASADIQTQADLDSARWILTGKKISDFDAPSKPF